MAQARVQGGGDDGDLDGAGLRDERVVAGGGVERLEGEREDMTAVVVRLMGEAPSVGVPTRSRAPRRRLRSPETTAKPPPAPRRRRVLRAPLVRLLEAPRHVAAVLARRLPLAAGRPPILEPLPDQP